MKINLKVISKEKNTTDTLTEDGVYFISSNGSVEKSMSDLTSNFLLIIELKEGTINISGVGDFTFLSTSMKKNSHLAISTDEIIYTQTFQVEFNFIEEQEEQEEQQQQEQEQENIAVSLSLDEEESVEQKSEDLSLPSIPINDLVLESADEKKQNTDIEKLPELPGLPDNDIEGPKVQNTNLNGVMNDDEIIADIAPSNVELNDYQLNVDSFPEVQLDASLPKISIDELLEHKESEESTIPLVPVMESDSETNLLDTNMVDQQLEEQSHVGATEIASNFIFLDTDRDDYIFSERKRSTNTQIGYKDCESIAEGFVDIYDQEREVKTNRKLFTDSKQKGLKVIHLHNGVVISDRFFSRKEKKVYISAYKESKKIFQMYDLPSSKKDILAYFKGTDIFVHKLEGFHITDDIGRITVNSSELLKVEYDKKIILTKGLSQLFVSHCDAPPILNNCPDDQVDERLIKSLIKTWAVALIPLILMFFLVDVPEKREEEEKIKPVVIHRKKKVKIPKKKIEQKKEVKVAESSASAAAAAASVTTPKVEKKIEPPKKEVVKPEKVVEKVVKPVKEIVKKTEPPKKVVKKVEKKIVKKVKAPAPKVVKKIISPKAKKVVVKTVKEVVKPKKRSFSFSSSTSKLKSVTRSTASLNNRIKGQLKTSIGALGAINNGPKFNASDVGVNTSITVGKLKTKGGFGRGHSGSAKGLSSKSSGMTVYSEPSTKVLGAIDPELIRKILREYIPQFRHCYQRDLKKNSKLKGVFDLVFQINGSGRGVNTAIKVNDSNSFSASGRGCLAKVIKLIQFPKPKGGGIVDVRQPMDFHSN